MERRRPLIPGLTDDIARECLARIPYTRLRSAQLVCKAWRQELLSLDFFRLRLSIGSARPILALVQAQTTRHSGPLKQPTTHPYRLAIFDPLSASWARVPPLPTRPTSLPLFCQVASVGSTLVVLGGWDPDTWEVLDEVHMYDFCSATWRKGTSMIGPRRSFFACTSNGMGRVYVAGGHDMEKNALRSAMAYDVEKDEWVPIADMARERDECKGVFQCGKFYVIGGYSTERQGRFETSGESFDAATGQWGPTESILNLAMCPRTCVASDDGKLHMCQAGELIEREGDTWCVLAQLPRDACVGPFLMMWQEKVVVIGAEKHGGPYVTRVLDQRARRGATWMSIDAPKEYVGHVQAGCCLTV